MWLKMGLPPAHDSTAHLAVHNGTRAGGSMTGATIIRYDPHELSAAIELGVPVVASRYKRWAWVGSLPTVSAAQRSASRGRRTPSRGEVP